MRSNPSTRRRALPVALATLAVLGASIAGCGADDDGEAVREVGSEAASGDAASGTGSGTGSGSASGLSTEEVAGTSDDPLVQAAVVEYQGYVVAQVEALVTDVRGFTDAVRAGDVSTAQARYAPSRQRWESIEPIAALITDIDGAVDARVDDFESTDDPAWTGWHKLEHILWETPDAIDQPGTVELADQLDADIATLADEAPELEITPLAVAKGAQELIEEVSEGKITGEEDRYSHTDLWDIAANVEGSRKAIELLRAALLKADADLLSDVEGGFDDVERALEPHARGEGWASFTELTEDDISALKAAVAGLSESLAEVPAALGLG